MTDSAFLCRFDQLLNESQLTLPDGPWREHLQPLYTDVVDANRELNLTRIVDEDDFLIKHLIDSLLVLRFVPELATIRGRLADVGCGAGFPGIPLALLNPHLQIDEIDNSGKKANYVAGLLTRLALADRGEAVHGKGRELARLPAYQGRFDIVVARAVTDTPSLIKECRQFLADGGSLIAYKTPGQVDEERKLTDREARKAKLTVEESPIFALPCNAGDRQFLRLYRG